MGSVGLTVVGCSVMGSVGLTVVDSVGLTVVGCSTLLFESLMYGNLTATSLL